MNVALDLKELIQFERNTIINMHTPLLNDLIDKSGRGPIQHFIKLVRMQIDKPYVEPPAIDPETKFLTEKCVSGSKKLRVGKTELYEIYRDWSWDQKIKPVSSRKFASAVLNSYPEVKETTIYATDGGRPRAWLGVTLK